MLIPKRVKGSDRQELVNQPGKSWKRWAREDLARYWYVILCMFLDLSLNLMFVESYSRYRNELNLILSIASAVALVPIIYLEYKIYEKLFSFRFSMLV